MDRLERRIYGSAALFLFALGLCAVGCFASPALSVARPASRAATAAEGLAAGEPSSRIPSSADAANLLAQAHFMEAAAEVEDCMEVLEEIIARYPNTSEAVHAQADLAGWHYSFRKNRPEGKRLHEALLKQYPEPIGRPEVLVCQAWDALAAREYDRSAELASRVIARFPNHAMALEARLVKGLALYFKKENAQAISLLEGVLHETKDPRLWGAAFDGFVNAYRDMLHTSAVLVEACNRILRECRLDPASEMRVHNRLLEHYQEKQNVDKSTEILARFGLLLALPEFQWGRIESGMRRAKDLERLLAERPTSSEARLLQQASYQRVIGYYQQVVQSRPHSPEAVQAQYLSGCVHLLCGQYRAASEAYRKVVQRYPTSAQAGWALLAISYAFQAEGKSEEGKEFYRSLLAGETGLNLRGLRFALTGFARHVVREQGYGAAYAALQEVAQSAGAGKEASLAAIYVLGLLYKDQDLPELAVTTWEDLLRKYPSARIARETLAALSSVRYELGFAAYSKGDFAAAVRHLAPMVESPGIYQRQLQHQPKTPKHCHMFLQCAPRSAGS